MSPALLVWLAPGAAALAFALLALVLLRALASGAESYTDQYSDATLC